MVYFQYLCQMQVFTLESFVTGLNIIYVILIAKDIKIGWWFGIAGSILYVFSCFEQQLFMECILNSYYVIAGFLGLYNWHSSNQIQLKPNFLGTKKTFFYTIMAVLSSVVVGFLLKKAGLGSLPYLDALVTFLSFLATYLATKKYIENWLLWLFADGIAIYLFYKKGIPVYMFLFSFYWIIALYGYFEWRKKVVVE